MNLVAGLQQHYETLEKDFHHHYVDVLREASEGSVHDLRVNMKKQVAFFRMLEYLDSSFSIDRALDAYGKLYQKAGRVRDYQVEKKVVRQDEKLLQLENRFSDWLEEQERRQREKLQAYESENSIIPVRRLGQLIRNRLSYLSGPEVKPRLHSYFGYLFSEIRRLLRPENRKEEQFHELRKRIKELFFNLKLLLQICRSQPVAAEDLEALDNFQQLLGHWHDSFFTLSRIREEEEQPCPEPLREKMEQDLNDYVQQILRRLDSIPGLIDRIESAFVVLFNPEPPAGEEQPEPPAAEGKKTGKGTFPSFDQVNVGEGTK